MLFWSAAMVSGDRRMALPVSERDPSVDRLLELLQYHSQWLLEQSSHQGGVEGGPEDRAGT